MDEELEVITTLGLGDKAVANLLNRLRPLIYIGGGCSCCNKSDQEKINIADEILDWWTELNIDNCDKEIIE